MGAFKENKRRNETNMTIAEERRVIWMVTKLYHEGKTPEESAKIVGQPIQRVHGWLKLIKASEKYAEK